MEGRGGGYKKDLLILTPTFTPYSSQAGRLPVGDEHKTTHVVKNIDFMNLTFRMLQHTLSSEKQCFLQHALFCRVRHRSLLFILIEVEMAEEYECLRLN